MSTRGKAGHSRVFEMSSNDFQAQKNLCAAAAYRRRGLYIFDYETKSSTICGNGLIRRLFGLLSESGSNLIKIGGRVRGKEVRNDKL